MNATSAATDEGREAGWRQGTPAVGGSVTDGEHTSDRRSIPATHASFFSGAGGLDIGLGAAGWRTVSFSEIDPFASAVLARHWPGVPNLGDITALAGPLVGHQRTEDVRRDGLPPGEPVGSGDPDHRGLRAADGDWTSATLWSGGFPCTDLSLAGKRAGLRDADGNLTRSGLAFAFLALVERHRPTVILMENVYGLLSSNAGRDLGALVRAMAELGYVGAYRGLDSQWFGVPQRRKRLFFLAFDAERGFDPDSASQVLALGTRCGRDHQAEREAWAQAAGGTGVRAALPGGQRLDRAPADSRGVRAASGVAGWVDGGTDVDLLPEGQDSHRYRAIGNGVSAPVAYWIGLRLRQYLEGTL